MRFLCARRLHPTMLAAVLAAGSLIASQSALAQQTTTAQNRLATASALVQGTGTTTSGATGAFTGVLTLTHFYVNSAGQLLANGTVNGVLTTATSTVPVATQTVTGLLVNSASGSCPILSLSLGPLHLNLLGLVVDLNQVNLNITAQPGAGNLLGNLLCDVANLLNNGGALATIATDLNNILNALGSL